MDLLLTDNVLDFQVCDFCLKFLSVLPVTVYHNRKIKCGRCVANNDDHNNVHKTNDGAESMYNLIAKRSIFQCINRFEGCSKLLKPSEVVKHEVSCQSNQKECPICSASIPVFLMIHHFKLNHKDYFLTSPSFTLNIARGIERHFLYKQENNLVFITFKDAFLISDSDYARNYVISCKNINKQSSINNFTAKFFHIRTNSVENKIVSNKDGGDCDITLNVTDGHYLDVFFSIDIQHTYNLIRIIPEKPVEFNKRDMLSSNLKSKYFQKRTILPDTKFRELFKDLSISEGPTISFTKNEEKVLITLSCHNCSLILPCFFSGFEMIYFVGNSGDYNLHCYLCKLPNSVNAKKLLDRKELELVKFFCIWNCGNFCTYTDLYKHERACKFQFAQECPIKSCSFYLKIFEFYDHFKQSHSDVNLANNIADLPQLLCLKPSESPIKKIFIVWFVCVSIEFTWEQSIWKVSLETKISGLKPRATIYGIFKEDTVFLASINGSGCFEHSEEIKILLRFD